LKEGAKRNSPYRSLFHDIIAKQPGLILRKILDYTGGDGERGARAYNGAE